MRLPPSAHTAQSWRIHEIAQDFELEDVWALPTPGGPNDFPRLVNLLRSFDPAKDSPYLVRTLFTVRFRLGGLLGLDDDSSGLDARVPSLRDRLPADLRDSVDDLEPQGLPFTPLFATADEFAAEIANKTVHGVIHIGWVADEAGGYRGQMAILVKPNGAFGRTYLAAIKPFRHLFVYPAMIQQIGRSWSHSTVTA